jgi:hypothetical protein
MARPPLTDEFDARRRRRRQRRWRLQRIGDGPPSGIEADTWLHLSGAVKVTTVQRTDADDYIAGNAVFCARAHRGLHGHWLDVDLNTPAQVTPRRRHAGYSFLKSKGNGRGRRDRDVYDPAPRRR